MSMIGNLARVFDETLAVVHANPSLVTQLLYPDMPVEVTRRPSLIARMLGHRQPEQQAAAPSIAAVSEADMLDIDKAWHAIHFLLTGSDWEGGFPEGFLVSCGQPVGDVDVGYGPARSFSIAETARISDYLSGLQDDDLRSRLDFPEMQELHIYPTIWDDESSTEDEWDYIHGNLDAMRRFLAETKSKGMALLVFLN